MRKSKTKYEDYDWNLLQKLHDNGVPWTKLSNTIKFLRRAESEGKLVRRKVKLSSETKKKMSDSKIKFFKENPDKHNWRNRLSKPCEKLKEILTENKLNFLPEYPALYPERNFSIDIAFPDKKIAIEVNGNQHYNNDGSLKKYYQDRHNLLKEAGWFIIEFHFSNVYKKEQVEKLINSLKNDFKITEKDYSGFIKIKEENKCIVCKKHISKNAKKCIQCLADTKKKCINRPPLESLLEDINSIGYEATGRKYNVTGNCVKKWIKKYGTH